MHTRAWFADSRLHRMRSALVIVIVLQFAALLHAAPEPINLQSLLREMVDRDALARWPSPQYVSREFTSYDRRSVSPDKPGWFANHDEGIFSASSSAKAAGNM